ncbi:MAG: cation diffusion facilitator family transporter [Burkholderiales bacterium]
MANHDHDPLHDHHGHSHSHGGGHHHAVPADSGRAFLIPVGLNVVFVAIEFASGFVANSTALMADAGHNLSDVVGLLLAWGAVVMARRQASQRYTYGLRSASILAALANAMLLLVASGAIALEAVQRFSQPPAVAGLTVSVVAAIGIAVNGFSAWLLMKGSKEDLNLRSAYLHMVADTVVSLGVVITGVAMLYTGWYWLDPVVSLVIVMVILLGTWSLLRESAQLALSAVPAQVDASAIEAYLRQLDGVTDMHDLHIWGLSTTENALTVHLVIPAGYPGDAFMDDVVHSLQERFKVHHSTLQIEQGTTSHACALFASNAADLEPKSSR